MDRNWKDLFFQEKMFNSYSFIILGTLQKLYEIFSLNLFSFTNNTYFRMGNKLEMRWLVLLLVFLKVNLRASRSDLNTKCKNTKHSSKHFKRTTTIKICFKLSEDLYIERKKMSFNISFQILFEGLEVGREFVGILLEFEKVGLLAGRLGLKYNIIKIRKS